MIANLYGAWAEKEIVPIDIMSTLVLYDFEDAQFYGPQDYDGYLKHLYNDYMKLPPEDMRHIHANEIYVITPKD